MMHPQTKKLRAAADTVCDATVAWNSLSFSLSLTLSPPMINKNISIQFFYPHPLRTVDMHSTEIHHLSPSLWNGIYIQYPPMRDGQTHRTHWGETKIKMKMTSWRELYRSRSSTWRSKLSLKFTWNESIDGLITSLDCFVGVQNPDINIPSDFFSFLVSCCSLKSHCRYIYIGLGVRKFGFVEKFFGLELKMGDKMISKTNSYCKNVTIHLFLFKRTLFIRTSRLKWRKR